MKKILIILFTALVMVIFCACGSSSGAGAPSTSSKSWEKAFYLDAFNDPTEEYYIGTSSHIKGTYNSSTVTDGKLEAEVRADAEAIRIMLYENGTDKVKNGSNLPISFPVAVKKADGSTFHVSGIMFIGADCVLIREQAEELLFDGYSTDSICKSLHEDGEISFYVTREDQPASNYLFTVKCGNFASLYDSEIVLPIQKETYAKAETMLANKGFEGAYALFKALGDYSDSAKRMVDVIEAKNADAYAKAEELLANKEYYGALDAFCALGDYRDSAKRMEDVIETMNTDYYTEAETFLTKKEYDSAIELFKKLGDYRDSSKRVEEVVEAKNADYYTQAETLLAEGHYDEAAVAFAELGDYRNSQIMADESLLQSATAMASAGNAVGAYKLLLSMEEYPPASELLQSFYYIPTKLTLSSITGEETFEFGYDANGKMNSAIYSKDNKKRLMIGEFDDGVLVRKIYGAYYPDKTGTLYRSYTYNHDNTISEYSDSDEDPIRVYDAYGNYLESETDKYHNVTKNASNTYDDDRLTSVFFKIGNLRRNTSVTYKVMYLPGREINMDTFWCNIRLFSGERVWLGSITM